MNSTTRTARTIRTLFVAVPLATAALTLAPGAAMADAPAYPGNGIVLAPADPGDPQPPAVDGELTSPTPKPDPDPGPQDVPDEKAPVPGEDPDPQPQPGHSDDLTDTPGCTHGCEPDPDPEFPLSGGGSHDDGGDDGEGDGGNGDGDGGEDAGCFTGCDLPEEPNDEVEVSSIAIPTRVDAGLGDQQDDGLQLSWLLAGGALVTAGGGALVARKRARANA